VVVANFDVGRAGVGPDEAHTKLVIDPDAVLALPVTPERLQPIGWRNPQIIQGLGGVEHGEFSHRSLFKTLKFFDRSSVEKTFGLGALEGLNGHWLSLALRKTIPLPITDVKRH
jgi:hypothetical protein